MKALSLALLLVLFSTTALPTTSLNLEVGQALNPYNEVRIDGKGGTLFSLSPALDSTFYYRLSFIKKFSSPHGLRLLYAPLKFDGEKNYSKNIDFNGVSFPSGNKIKAEYKFNSYRATYFYEVISDRKILLRLGGTLKVRDASIELEQDNRKKAKKNVGVVPLFYLYSEYKWDNNIRLGLDFDGLIAPQGRAIDVALMAGYYFTQDYLLNFGYRMLEGGVDNEEVYNFSQINYYFTALQVNF